VYEPLTKFQCCPTSDGAAAAIVCSEEFARKHGVADRPQIAAMAMTTDFSSTFDAKSMIKMVGQDLTKAAAEKVYEQAGIGPQDIQVIELHDCFTPNELITYEGIGLCAEGEAAKLIEDDQTTYGGKWVVNPSGGLLAKGHPLGATGLAQCFELNQQLRGLAGNRQVDGARVALQHNLGLGGACVMTVYRLD
jgi:acetyl-CoA acetyltransferase